MKMLIWQQVKTPPDEAESHLCKHQQQFLDQIQTQTQVESPFFLQKEKRNTNTKTRTWIKTHLLNCFDFDFDLIWEIDEASFEILQKKF